MNWCGGKESNRDKINNGRVVTIDPRLHEDQRNFTEMSRILFGTKEHKLIPASGHVPSEKHLKQLLMLKFSKRKS